MPFLNAKCFYCGARTGQRSHIVNRQWKCSNCEAINYLDDAGQISDPPDTLTAQPFVKYAYPVRKSTSPVSSHSEKSLFCATCLKNQHLVTQTLAEYLPPSNQHDHSIYESSSEQYRRGLEQRYPQVCARCEPGVQQHLKIVDYAAKTDHLRRMIENTKRDFKPAIRKGWGLRETIVVLIGVLSYVSIFIQLLWHMFGIALEDSSDWSLQYNYTTNLVQSCTSCLLKTWTVHYECYKMSANLTKYALFMACCSIFWNRKLLQKIRRPGGRLVRWDEHFRLQIITIIMRTIAWWYLYDTSSISFARLAFKGAHIFMIVLISVCTITSYNLIDITYTPKFTFVDNPKPSENGENYNLQTSSEINANQKSLYEQSFRKQSQPYNNSFPISNLASRQTPPSLASLPLSPLSSVASTVLTESESEYDDGNEMEWTPTKPAFPNLQPMRPLNMFGEEQTTDKANLLGYSLRNDQPNNSRQLGFAPSNQPFQTIQRGPISAIRKGYLGVPSKVKKQQQDSTEELNEDEGGSVFQFGGMKLSESKLKLPEGILDTGLEPLFEKFFAIRDEPPEITNVPEDGVDSNLRNMQNSSTKTWLMTTTASLIVGLAGIAMHFYG